MTTIPPIERQVHLEQLGSFCRGLLHAWAGSQCAERVPDGMAMLLSGQCIQCGLSVSGEELLQAAVGLNPAPKAARLRQGYCARRGCNSYYYRIGFKNADEVDWPELLAAATVGGAADLPELDPTPKNKGGLGHRWRWAIRTLAIVSAVTALLVLWQWHRGGTIPFLREAEQFEVDHFGAEEATN